MKVKKEVRIFAVWCPDGGMEPLQVKDVTTLASHPAARRNIQLAIYVLHWEQIPAKSEKAAKRIYWSRRNHPKLPEKAKRVAGELFEAVI
jgi:hypothetical protein